MVEKYETKIERVCKYCGRKFYADDVSYHINPFCSQCLPERLKTVSLEEVKFTLENGYGVFIPVSRG